MLCYDMSDTRISCPDCGPVPAGHRMLWIGSTGDVLTFALPTHRLPLYSFLSKLGDWAAEALGRSAYALGRALGLITLSSDIETSASRRSRLLWLEARRRGIPMEQLLLLGKPTDTFRVCRQGRTHFFKSLPFPSVSVDALRMDDKVSLKRAMRSAGLPVPRSFSARTQKGAERALAAVGIACVKPRSGSNGRHTYPHVSTPEELREALAGVRQICAFASVEEQLEGNLCRATCVDGRMIGFLESFYPRVTGDGVSTIQELVARKNALRPDGVEEIVLTSSHEGYLHRRGYALDTVLPAGASIPLTFRAGAGQGGGNREHGRAIHPSFIEPIEKAARLTGLSIVGFDLIIPDASRPADEQTWGFIEANSLPWIDLHAAPHEGAPIDLSPAVWDAWLRSLQAPARDTR